MTLTINLTPELESQLHESASAAGIDPQSYALSVLAADLRRPRRVAASKPHLSAEESRLLVAINEGLPQASWRRYRQLGEKLRAESITASELDEFRSLTDTIEVANAKRLERLIELAKVRNVAVDELMHELGIRDPGYV